MAADWNSMCQLEPRLLELERIAIRLGRDKRYEAYESVKTDLSHLVGWGAEKEELRSDEAWQVAMQHTAMKCAP